MRNTGHQVVVGSPLYNRQRDYDDDPTLEMIYETTPGEEAAEKV